MVLYYTLYMIILAWLCFVFLVFLWLDEYRKKHDRKLLQSVTSLDRGTYSERVLVLSLLKHGIPAEYIFHDLYLKMDNNQFSQIDVAIVTDIGIIIFEVKDYSWWLLGNSYNSYWTQVLAYGREKYRFYNPIRQNYNHIQNLHKHISGFENVPIYSAVVFYGNCVLRHIENLPNTVMIWKSEEIFYSLKELLKKHTPVSYMNKEKVLNFLKESVDNGANTDIQHQHIENITTMLWSYKKTYHQYS